MKNNTLIVNNPSISDVILSLKKLNRDFLTKSGLLNILENLRFNLVLSGLNIGFSNQEDEDIFNQALLKHFGKIVTGDKYKEILVNFFLLRVLENFDSATIDQESFLIGYFFSGCLSNLPRLNSKIDEDKLKSSKIAMKKLNTGTAILELAYHLKIVDQGCNDNGKSMGVLKYKELLLLLNKYKERTFIIFDSEMSITHTIKIIKATHDDVQINLDRRGLLIVKSKTLKNRLNDGPKELLPHVPHNRYYISEEIADSTISSTISSKNNSSQLPAGRIL